jgi:hypothetical protein
MGTRFRGLIVITLLLSVGAFAGSALSQWWGAVPVTMPGAREAAAGAAGAEGRGDGVAGSSVNRVPLPVGERVRVEVLNGGGRPNMARAATDHLREVGFDVVFFGNARNFDRDSSVVYVRTGQVDWARSVAGMLGISEVIDQPDEELFLDVTVVLGQEWDPQLALLPLPVDSVEVTPWWDPRTWFPRRPMAPNVDQQLADPGTSGAAPDVAPSDPPSPEGTPK